MFDTIFTTINFRFFLTLLVTVALFLYVIFAIILFNKTRALGRIVFIEASAETILLNMLAFLHFLASVLLFVFALGILI